MKIIVACDSFKGSLDNLEVSTLLAGSITNHTTYVQPLSDGGEGFLNTMPGERLSTRLNAQDVHYQFEADSDTVFIESARVLGNIKLIGDDPMKRSSYYLGALIKQTLKHRPKRIVIGLGGSLTNDGGAGLLAGLGADFKNTCESFIPTLDTLDTIVSVNLERINELFKGIDILVYCDVTNPFLGALGATRTYGAQKGYTKAMVDRVEKKLYHFANFISVDPSQKFTGAAGGTAFGLNALPCARLVLGSEAVIKVLNLDEIIKNADVVITGEGKYDSQSQYGKVVHSVLLLTKRYKKSTIGVFGQIESIEAMEDFDAFFTIIENAESEEEAIANAAFYIKKIGQNIANRFK